MSTTTMTAKNYAAQAEAGMQSYINQLKYQGRYSDAKEVENIKLKLKQAVHFAIPDNGRIFDDKLKGIRDLYCRLPYPLCTIEFSNDDIPDEEVEKLRRDGQQGALIKKVVIVAEDDPEQDRITFYPVVCFTDGLWKCTPYNGFFYKDGKQQFTGDGYFCGATLLLSQLQGLPENAETAILKTLSIIAKAVMEFLEVLSCKNVEQTLHQAQSPKNKQRIKSHKLPIWETKCLTIKSTIKAGNATGVVGTGTTQKQHMRMGHIRRLESGNIWVNSYVAGDASKGVIVKNYNVTA